MAEDAHSILQANKCCHERDYEEEDLSKSKTKNSGINAARKVTPDCDCDTSKFATLGSDCDPSKFTTLGSDCDLSESATPSFAFESRLSCEELETILQRLRTTMTMPLDLPRNDGPVIDCHLMKELSQDDAAEKIKATVDEFKQWADRLGQMLLKHVDSHRFTEAETRRMPGRRRDSERTVPKVVDSGICSQEVNLPSNIPIQESGGDDHSIESIKEGKEERTQFSWPRDKSPPRDGHTSFSCNVCYDACLSCPCQHRTVHRARRGSRPQVIVSMSQLTTDSLKRESTEKN